MTRLLLSAAAGAATCFWSQAASATTRSWIGPGSGVSSGSWSVAGNWTPSGVPGNGDDVFIPRVGLSNTNVTYDYTGPIVLLNSLHVSSNTTPALPRTSYLTMSANTLNATEEDIGDSSSSGRGRGEMDQSGGTNDVAELDLGKTAQSSGTFDFGTYNLSGSGVIVADGLTVGDRGGGEFNQSGGSLSTFSAVIGGLTGSNGTYNLSGGTLQLNSTQGTTAGSLIVGYFGDGTFIQSSGVVEPIPGGQGALDLGDGGTGWYSLGAGTLWTSGGSEEIGQGGTGTFNQSGGANDLGDGQLHLGDSNGAGYYNLSGTGIIKAGGLGIGQPDDGTAVFDQNGGTVTVGGLGIANISTTAQGAYKMENGNLIISASTIYIGGSGTGSFEQTGGTVSTTAASPILLLGDNPGSVATYSLSAGTLLDHGADEYIGYQGAATFNQSGGAHDVSSGSLYLGSGAQSSGYYSLGGTGSLTVGSLIVGDSGQGTFVMNAGTLSAAAISVGHGVGSGYFNLSGTGVVNVTGLGIGQSGDGTAVFDQNGGTITVGSLGIANGDSTARGTYKLENGTLIVTGTQIFIGGSGSASFIQTGGTFSAPLDNLILIGANPGSAATYSLTDGTFLGEDAIEDLGDSGAGTFIQSGGVNNLTGGSLYLGALPNVLGYYSLSGTGSLTVDNFLTVGAQGQGTFVMSGGTLSAGYLTVAESPGSIASFNQTKGYITSINEYIAEYGTGSFLQSAGTHTISGTQIIGGTLFGAGTYLLNGGTLEANFQQISAGTETTGNFSMTDGTLKLTSLSVGNQGAGTFAQSGGSAVVFNTCRIGEYPTGAGTMELSGGTATIWSLSDGFVGAGTLNLSGTAQLNTSTIEVGHDAASKGVLNISAGSITTQTFTLGQEGSSTMNQFGGLVWCIDGSIDLAAGTTSTSTYSMFDGTLSVTDGEEIIGDSGAGTFIQAQGSHILSRESDPNNLYSQLIIANNSGSTGQYILAGTASLSVANREDVGYGGTGTFTQTGGLNSTGALYVGAGTTSTASYQLTSGTLSANNIYVGGSDTTSGGTATLTVGPAATLTVAGMLKAWNAGNVLLSSPTRVGSVSAAGNGKIDLTNSAMVVDYAPGASPIISIASLIHSAYAAGAWTGPGLTSSTARSDSISLHPTALGFAEASQIFSSFPATFMGLSVDSTSVLIRYTFVGDANLDGTVNALDFNLLATNYGQSPGNEIWSQGDFNYDGTVNSSDFDALAVNYGQTIPATTALPLGTVVPEPTSFFLTFPAIFGLIGRKRKVPSGSRKTIRI